MSRPSTPPPFRFSHGAWNSLPAQPLGEKGTLRHLTGAESANWRLDLAVGARLASPGLRGECLLSVWAGQVVCELLGNQVDLPAGHFALLPPNVPFTLRAAGQDDSVVIGSLRRLTDEAIPFEPL